MMDEKLEFLRSCKICIDDAAQDGRKRYVRRRGVGFTVSGDGGEGWLFMAYPGGRKIFSVEGKQLAEQLEFI
ncbi:hypothetical protein KC887_01405 [Candidatus Kaiserbacteria bacterium]|nr:hypothetical protein [Candidatus Kaiserbacteria bacterium]